MAKGVVVYHTAEEWRRTADELVKLMSSDGDNTEFNKSIQSLMDEVEKVGDTTRLRNLKLLARVYQFRRDILDVVVGSSVSVAFDADDGFIGELVSVTVKSKGVCFKNLGFIKSYKDIIYSVDISDYLDGHFEVIFAFNGALISMEKGEI